MTVETAIERLKAADPAPVSVPVRDNTDDFTALLLATWQRSTNVQTQKPPTITPDNENPKRAWLITAAVAAATIIVIGAVALLSSLGSSPEIADTPTTTAVDATPSSTTSTPIQAGPSTIEVEAFDYGFRGLPSELSAGDAIEFFNSSATEYHNLVVIRLDEDDDRTVGDFAVLPADSFGAETPQEGFNIIGGLHAAPGEAACDGRIRLQIPGRYLIIDMVPQGANAAVVDAAVCTDGSDGGGAPYRVPGGPLGYQHGMITIVTVK